MYELKQINPNFKIFLDLKLYDIPNTMADAAYEIAKLPVDMFNIHASSFVVAMQKVMQEVYKIKNRPLVLAVTVLTSFDTQSFEKIYHTNIDKAALEMAKDAFRSGLDGVVCSVFESKAIKENTSKDFITLSPGIRRKDDAKGDQKRVATVQEAKKNLVDFIVVGRPIYKSKNPKKALEEFLQQI